MLFFHCEIGTGKKPDQINGICRGPCFIKIVHAPDQPTFQVAPGSEIIDMEIPDGQYLSCARKFRANKRPVLSKPVKRRAEKRERGFGHVHVLEVNIRVDQIDVARSPFFEISRCGNYVG